MLLCKALVAKFTHRKPELFGEKSPAKIAIPDEGTLVWR